MEAGVRRHITSPSALADCGYGWDAIYLVLDSLLNPIATGAPVSGPPCPHLSPPDGTHIKGSGGTAYVMLDGSKLLIASPDVFSDCGCADGNVNIIPDSMLDSISDGLILTG